MVLPAPAEGGDGEDDDEEEDDEDEDDEDEEDVPPVGDNRDPPQTVGYKRFANGEQCYLFCRNILSNFHTHQPLNDVSSADLAVPGSRGSILSMGPESTLLQDWLGLCQSCCAQDRGCG